MKSKVRMCIKTLFWFYLTIIVLPAYSKVKTSDVEIYFYTKSNPVLGNSIDVSDSSQLGNAEFSPNRDTVFLIHGYMERPTLFDSSSQALKNVILSKFDANVFVIGYSKISTNFYHSAVEEVEAVGKTLASIIKDIVKNNGLELRKTKIVGISLGAHVAGVAGNALGGEISQIIGVDPAGPLFTLENSSNRLTKTSAKFVHVIHTCGGRFGFLEPLGHADYYVNGGRRQPSCGVNSFGLCSHILSVTYYSESLLTGNFKAKKCSNYSSFQKGRCNGTEESWMGEFEVDKDANGTYYLDTNLTPPYAKG